jgi:hypothetical protein
VHVAADSTQHRTPKVTPRRHVNAGQQSLLLAHTPRTIEHMHDAAPKFQSPHEPLLGPLAVPP